VENQDVTGLVRTEGKNDRNPDMGSSQSEVYHAVVYWGTNSKYKMAGGVSNKAFATSRGYEVDNLAKKKTRPQGIGKGIISGGRLF